MNNDTLNAVKFFYNQNIVDEQSVKLILESKYKNIDPILVLANLAYKLYDEDFIPEAVSLLTSNSLNQDPFGNYILATYYYSKGNYDKARAKFDFASNHGYTRSYIWLGKIFEYGLTDETDFTKALKFYSLGADCGYIYSEKLYLDLKYRGFKSSLSDRIAYWVKLFKLTFKAFLIAIKDLNDERLAEIQIKN